MAGVIGVAIYLATLILAKVGDQFKPPRSAAPWGPSKSV